MRRVYRRTMGRRPREPTECPANGGGRHRQGYFGPARPRPRVTAPRNFRAASHMSSNRSHQSERLWSISPISLIKNHVSTNCPTFAIVVTINKNKTSSVIYPPHYAGVADARKRLPATIQPQVPTAMNLERLSPTQATRRPYQ